MRIARGPVALKIAVVLVSLSGLAACGLPGGDTEAQQVAPAGSVSSPAGPGSTAAPSARPTGSPTPASRKTSREKPTKKKKSSQSSTTKKRTPKTTTTTTKRTPKATTSTKKRRPTTKPPTTTTTKPSGGGGSTSTDSEAEVLRLVNVERDKAGCKPLKEDSTLVAVARAHSRDMAENNYFSHTGKDGRSPFDRMKDAGYSYRMAAENIAAGQGTAKAVMDAWMNSSGHRANILNCGLTEIGVGRWKDSSSSYGIYWTQNFGTPA